MKKIGFLSFSVVANTVCLSLGFKCLLDLLAVTMAVSPDSGAQIQYPRYIPFLIVVGIAALAGFIAMLIWNFNVSEKFKFTKIAWIGQYAGCFVAALPMIKVWEILFDFLHKTF